VFEVALSLYARARSSEYLANQSIRV